MAGHADQILLAVSVLANATSIRYADLYEQNLRISIAQYTHHILLLCSCPIMGSSGMNPIAVNIDPQTGVAPGSPDAAMCVRIVDVQCVCNSH